MDNNSNEQLRVRLTSKQRRALNELVEELGSGITISKFIRGLIDEYCNENGNKSIFLSRINYERLLAYAAKLRRPPAQIANECIEGLFWLVEKKKSPLLAEEIKLHRKYVDPSKDTHA